MVLVIDHDRKERISAFADDVAVILHSVFRLHIVLNIFVEFGDASLCVLHPSKSIWVGVFEPDAAERRWFELQGGGDK